MNKSMSVGAENFFKWADSEDAYVEIGYAPACGELEVRVHILGEPDFYRKRAGNFEFALEAAEKMIKEHRKNRK